MFVYQCWNWVKASVVLLLLWSVQTPSYTTAHFYLPLSLPPSLLPLTTPTHTPCHQQVRYRQHVPKASHITIDFSKAC